MNAPKELQGRDDRPSFSSVELEVVCVCPLGSGEGLKFNVERLTVKG